MRTLLIELSDTAIPISQLITQSNIHDMNILQYNFYEALRFIVFLQYFTTFITHLCLCVLMCICHSWLKSQSISIVHFKNPLVTTTNSNKITGTCYHHFDVQAQSPAVIVSSKDHNIDIRINCIKRMYCSAISTTCSKQILQTGMH